jgi:hypothetical protein
MKGAALTETHLPYSGTVSNKLANKRLDASAMNGPVSNVNSPEVVLPRERSVDRYYSPAVTTYRGTAMLRNDVESIHFGF